MSKANIKDASLGPVMLDITGLELQQEEREVLAHPQVGGLILFTRNFESLEQLNGLVRCVREVRKDLVISVDHEGGRVQRFREGFTVLPAMQTLFKVYQHSPEDAVAQSREMAWLLAAELLASDIDISFAPVLDLDDSYSDIIGDRSFSPEPEVACSLIEAFVDGMHEAGMATTGKHFPGHGGVKADSHKELPVDERDLAQLKAHDLLPFVRLKDKLDALMSAHILFPSTDNELVSFSSFWLKQFLRDDLGYEGLVFSDDLTMEGAAGIGGYSARAKAALLAGCDVVLVCNNPDGAIEVLESLEKENLTLSCRCLSTMAKRKAHEWGSLRQSERWKNAQRCAEALNTN